MRCTVEIGHTAGAEIPTRLGKLSSSVSRGFSPAADKIITMSNENVDCNHLVYFVFMSVKDMQNNMTSYFHFTLK